MLRRKGWWEGWCMRGGGCGRLLGEGEGWMVVWFERGGGRRGMGVGVCCVWGGGEVGWYRFLTFVCRFGLLGVRACLGKEKYVAVRTVLRPCS